MADMQLKDLIGKLIANENVIGLVKMMQPMDIVAVISVDLDLQDGDAESVVANLLQHARHEGMGLPGIETNKQYPVPAKIRRDNEVEEDYINNLGQMNPDISPDHFPPEPRPDAVGWPYDGMTKAIMDPKNKGRKRPLMQGVFDPNFKKRQPGGDYGGSQGIYSRETPHADNSQSSSGRSYDAKGRPGWSSSPPGKEFDLPNEIPDEEDLPDNIIGPSPVGSPIPQFQGGHSQQRRMGFRRR